MLIKSVKPQAEPAPTIALEEIDYLIGAQQFSSTRCAMEELQADIVHGVDIAASLENLELVLEQIKEIDVHDAALIHVIGDIAGASSGVSGRAFTPSLEATQDNGPSLKAKVTAIYDQIAKVIRMIVSKVKAYVAYLFSDAHKLAKAYENLGEKISTFNFTEAQVVTLTSMAGPASDPTKLVNSIHTLVSASNKILETAPGLLTAQIDYIYAAEKNGIDGVNGDLQRIEQLSMAAGRGLALKESGDEVLNPVLAGSVMINDLVIQAQVFDYDGVNKEFSEDLIRRAFSAQIGLVHSGHEATPRQATFTMNHQLAKDIYEALRPLIHSLVDDKQAGSYYAQLKKVEAEGERIDAWLHATKTKAETQTPADARLLTLYRVGLSKIGGGQLAAFIRTHQQLSNTAMVIMDYLNKSLKAPKVQAETSPLAAA